MQESDLLPRKDGGPNTPRQEVKVQCNVQSARLRVDGEDLEHGPVRVG